MKIVNESTFLNESKQFLAKYSDLLSSVTILITDIFFLLGESLKSFPKIVGNGAFVFLNITGLLSISFLIDLLKKTIHDFKFSYKMKNYKIFLITIIKIVFVISSILLLNLSFIAAIFKILELPSKMNKIYMISKPYSSLCILTSIFLDIFHYKTNKKIIHSNLSKKQILNVSNVLKNETPCNDKFINKYCAEIRDRMDKDTLRSYLNNLKMSTNSSKNSDLFFNIVIANIKTQSIIDISNLGLKALGYLSMFICVWYASTVIQALVCTSMSLLYTSQLAYQKYIQYYQQKRAKIIYQI